MGIVELLTAIGLSMDAFAVSVCKGLGMRKMRYDQALVIGLYFGVFQALMPLLGWLLGTSFSRYIQVFDHWIAFVFGIHRRKNALGRVPRKGRIGC